MYAPWPPAVDLSSVNVAGVVPLSATVTGTFAHWTNTRIVFPAAGLTLQVTARLVPEPTAARLLFCPRVMATGQRAPAAISPLPYRSQRITLLGVRDIDLIRDGSDG